MLLLTLRLVLSSVLGVAAIAKLLDRPGSQDALIAFGVPEGFVGAGAVLLPACELVLACALLITGAARAGAIGALLLLAGFSGNRAHHGGAARPRIVIVSVSFIPSQPGVGRSRAPWCSRPPRRSSWQKGRGAAQQRGSAG
ncbi:MAG TPA: MauE/DoxX family redox-associated membrane protein [Solirubrobacteraceae bacterium]|nr:MauE/DoxX family redox-associated membrane protein [Solirubrobacteraceae bacterium]